MRDYPVPERRGPGARECATILASNRTQSRSMVLYSSHNLPCYLQLLVWQLWRCSTEKSVALESN
eukprot:9135-Heterococcus_DN1.PRE.9